jgi:hypothetical protein
MVSGLVNGAVCSVHSESCGDQKIAHALFSCWMCCRAVHARCWPRALPAGWFGVLASSTSSRASSVHDPQETLALRCFSASRLPFLLVLSNDHAAASQPALLLSLTHDCVCDCCALLTMLFMQLGACCV